jgi:protein SCO1
VRSTSARRCAAAALAAAALLSAAGCGGSGNHAASAPPAKPSALRGLVPQPLPRTPRFTLTDTAGRPFSFPARTRGKLAYLYFGYTHCPDACPATMDDLLYALRRQPPAVRRRVEVVFVTVDPHRDTKRRLRTWLDHFSRSFVGLTGTETQIERAERASGIPYVRGVYTQHSSFVLPFSPDGRAHVVYAQGFRPDDYAHDLPLLLRY